MVREIKNKAFRRLMDENGMSDIILCKGEGYFYVTSDNREVAYELDGVESIYVCHFNQYTPQEWVETIKQIVNH